MEFERTVNLKPVLCACLRSVLIKEKIGYCYTMKGRLLTTSVCCEYRLLIREENR